MTFRGLASTAVAPAVGLSVLLFVHCDRGDRGGVKVGTTTASACKEDKASCVPAIEMRDLAGSVIKPKALEGKVVLVNVWATWCKPCKKEIPDLVSLRSVFPEKDFMLIGVVSDRAGDAEVKAFAESYKINYPIVRMDGTVRSSLGNPNKLPTTFIYGRDGKLEYEAVGIKSEGDLAIQIERLL